MVLWSKECQQQRGMWSDLTREGDLLCLLVCRIYQQHFQYCTLFSLNLYCGEFVIDVIIIQFLIY